MANAVDGIGTINVGQLVTQLMSLEGRQQAQLKAAQTREQATLTAYQQLNANVKNVQTAAEGIIGTVLAPKAWSVLAATSSSSSVAATASPTAIPGSYSFDVVTVAAAHKVLYGGTLDLTSTACADPVTITKAGGTPVTLDLKGDHTLQGLATAINSTAGLGVKAALLQTAPNAYRLQLTSTSTGEAGQFTVSGLDAGLGAATVVTPGADASIKFGPAAGDVATSSSNTFSSLFPGVSVTVSKPESGVSLTVATDSAAMAKQVQSMVDAVNTTLSTIAKQTAYDVSSRSGGPLTGDLLAGQLSTTLMGTVFVTGDTTSLASLGIQTTRTGALTLDTAKLSTALTADPDGTKAAITAFATRVASAAEAATRSGTGSITSAIQGRQDEITSLSKGIAAWDLRLAVKKDQLTRQFSALNTALSKMQDQSTWLSGQLAKLSNG